MILLLVLALSVDDQQTLGPILQMMKLSSDEEGIKLKRLKFQSMVLVVLFLFFSGNQKRAIRIVRQLHCGVAAIKLHVSGKCIIHALPVLCNI